MHTNTRANQTSNNVMSRLRAIFITASLFSVLACQTEEILVQTPVIVAQFDPTSGVIPTPNDLLVDRETGLISIPIDESTFEEKSAAEIEGMKVLNTREAWSTRTEAKLTFSGALDPATVDATTLQVFEAAPGLGFEPVDAVLRLEPADAPTTVVVEVPEGGWTPGAQVIVAALGGDKGLRGANAEPVVADAAFWFLRLEESLLDHTKALPGATEEERVENAQKLEEIRLDLMPHFESFEAKGVARTEIAQLWSFHVTKAPELFMDKDAGKMPVPSDFLRNPLTGLVELPIKDTYSDFKADSVRAINKLDGFGLSSPLFFDLTLPIQPSTLNEESVRLFEVKPDGSFRERSLERQVRVDNKSFKLKVSDGILEQNAQHVLIVTDALKTADGQSIEAMSAGILAMSDAPVVEDAQSTISSIDLESAQKLELVRETTAGALQGLAEAGTVERETIRGAWSFKTQDLKAPMMQMRNLAASTNTSPHPTVVERKSAWDAVWEFPIGIVSMFNVGEVVHGTLEVPNTLDHSTRERFDNGAWNRETLPFTLTLPSELPEAGPLKVVIFGHALVTERRMLFAVADAMAQNGYATLAIDFPYHGSRTHCAYFGPTCYPDPLNEGEMLCPEPCQDGTVCIDDGRCVDNSGEGNYLNTWPVIPMFQASGATFLDLENLPGTRDHFYQAYADLSTLLRSIKEGDWKSITGYDFDTEVGYAGQSLGGILGTVFTAIQPTIARSVLNVPGGDLVSLFRNSDWFQPHFDKFVEENGFVLGSEEYDQMMLIAGWMLDAVDPQSYTPYLKKRSFDTELPLERDVIIQMATFDNVIPNSNTRVLSDLSGVPLYEYPASHAFLVVPVEPAYPFGMSDLSDMLTEGVYP